MRVIFFFLLLRFDDNEPCVFDPTVAQATWRQAALQPEAGI